MTGSEPDNSDPICSACDSGETAERAAIITEDPIGDAEYEADTIHLLCEEHFDKIVDQSDCSTREVPLQDPGNTRNTREWVKDEEGDRIVVFDPERVDAYIQIDDEDDEIDLSNCT